MEIIAKYRKAKSPAQKVRLIVDMIRGKKVIQVFDILNFHKKKSAFFVYKLLKSAVANAEHNYGIDVHNLIIKKIFVDSGPVMKRMMPRAKGRSDRILKRTSHITVILSDQ
ncbi:50S ribosomal protein L22 [Buchnera aphidicola]|uniref:Large ribosomal subunit protein uL22 n=1 Tax=Buchnera aphidicola (Sarucallis kahawaluokalani) TaxID=1241878 RepID=A0A4D6Y9Q4_9GAMM|nr:50S ribosomal protein L22 [Buchnera aphidicola]QCI26129.1 50S ribosomal protein L22 [Buchnera aphidicola (Sarucallis kahawaluokalani)]